MAVRVAIVGAGGIARRHGRACQQVAATELAAVCDARPEAAARLAAEFGAPRHVAGLDALLDLGPFDIVIVATWGDSHADITTRLAHSGQVRAILCEKPLCLTAAEAATMIDAASAGSVLLAEAFKFRHHPAHLAAAAALRDGRLGAVRYIRSTFAAAMPDTARDPAANWRFRATHGGGAIYDLGCYCLHHARWLMCAEPDTIQATGMWDAATGVDDTVAATLAFPGGRAAQFWISFGGPPSQVVEVYGDHGWLRLDLAWNNEDQPTALEWHDGRGHRHVQHVPPAFQFALQLQHLADCLTTGQPHRIPPADSLAQMRAIDALYAALRGGETVRL